MSEKLDKKINYKEHILRFILVTVVLFLINLILTPNHWWFYFPMAIVAIILIAKYIKVVFIDD
jgi:hypothetical protein